MAGLSLACRTFAGYPVVLDTHNYWNQETKTIHVAPGQSVRVFWHEACHGWQGESLDQNDIGLVQWKRTSAGVDFNGSLEQAADVCAYHCMGVPITADYTEYDYIVYVDPSWDAWAREWVQCPSH